MTTLPPTATTHAAVTELLRGPGWSSDQRNASQVPDIAGEALSKVLLFMDAPDHTRLRRLVSKAFTPRSIELLRPRIAELAEGLLAPLRAIGEFDVVSDFAFPFPVTVICELLGVPSSDRELFRTLTGDMAAVLDLDATPEEFGGAAGAAITFTAYLAPLFEQRRRTPEDDLISALVAAEDAGDRLDAAELATTVIVLLVAGHETTTNLIGNGLLALLRHPDQLHRLRARPDLMASAVEELLRYDPPVRRIVRIAMHDTIVDGQRVRAGEQVIAMLDATNRDPTVFAAPDTLDITPDASHYLAFASGPHCCLGAALARAEAQIALGALIKLPDLKLDIHEPRWRPLHTLHALEALPMNRPGSDGGSGYLVSNPDRVGLGSVERRFELCGWHVVAVAVEAVLVEPVHPRQRLELELVDVVPHRRRVWAANALGLVEPLRRLGQRVVAVGDGADARAGADLVEALGEPHRLSCDPASEWVTSPTSRRLPRERRAISSASRTISVFMFDATRQPTIRRENASTMKQT